MDIHKSRRDELKSRNPYIAARIDSCSEEGAIIVTTLPKYAEDSIINKFMMRERLEMRLGLEVSYIQPGPCLCTTNGSGFVDTAGLHLLSHCTAGNERSVTHNAICDELVHMARAANLSARREDRQVILGCLPDSKMRMDVIIHNFENGASLSIDVSVIDCRNG